GGGDAFGGRARQAGARGGVGRGPGQDQEERRMRMTRIVFAAFVAAILMLSLRADAREPDPLPSNLYDRLGVASNATEEQLKTAYRARMREWHPDVGQERRTAA